MLQHFTTFLLFGGVLVTPLCFSAVFERGRTVMVCHRMANRDVPENTLESLRAAKQLGCDVVEIDISETLDGELTMLHDGPIDRLNDGSGVVDRMLWDELRLYDAGAWMSPRFAGFRMPLFRDVLREARDLGLALNLDIKTEGIGRRVLQMVREESMIDRVRFGGLWDDVRQAYPAANEQQTAVWNPEMSTQELGDLQKQGKFVIANFSANGHEMDLDLMRKAVAAGVDVLNTDFPRLGAEALDRPIEAKVRALIDAARKGRPMQRARAVLELGEYRDFFVDPFFVGLLGDEDAAVARASAVAVVKRRRVEAAPMLRESLTKSSVRVRANAAWALGFFGGRESKASSESLARLLENEQDVETLRETLLAIARLGVVPQSLELQRFIPHADPLVTGAAALVAARSGRPDAAALITKARDEMRRRCEKAWADFRKKPAGFRPSQKEMDSMNELYRGYVKLARALADLPDSTLLAEEAFHSSNDLSQSGGVVAGFQLWDRVGEDLGPAIRALESSDSAVSDRAEWALVKTEAQVSPAVRAALPDLKLQGKKRAIRVLAWRGDRDAVAQLRELAGQEPDLKADVDWAISKIDAIASLY